MPLKAGIGPIKFSVHNRFVPHSKRVYTRADSRRKVVLNVATKPSIAAK